MKIAQTRRLNALNRLLAAATGSDADTVAQLSRAIEFCHRKGPRESEIVGIETIARRLLNIHARNSGRFRLVHCNLRDVEVTPLWLEAEVTQSVRRLARSREGLLLITGLKKAVCPPGKRFTLSRQREYQRAVTQINDIARARKLGANLSVIVV